MLFRSRSRDILNHMKNKFQNMSACQLISSSTTPVHIHLYEDTKAYLLEILFHSNLEGNINLHKLKVELFVDRSLHISMNIHFNTIVCCNNHRFWICISIVSFQTMPIHCAAEMSWRQTQHSFGCLYLLGVS